MKTKLVVSLLLCISLLAAQAQTNLPAKPPSSDDVKEELYKAAKGGLCEAVLVIGCLAVAGTFVVWAMNRSSRANQTCCVGPCTLVLEEDSFNNIWIPIATNRIEEVCHTNKFEVFRQVMDFNNHRYKVKILKE